MATYKKGEPVQLSENFVSTEFDCKCKRYCKSTEIDPELVEHLQKIRDHFGKPVTINSAYRCKKHNASVGGAVCSKHLYGMAADIKVEDVEPLKVAQYAESIGIKGIGLYSKFVHIDTRLTKFFWYGKEQKRRTTFGKYEDESKPTESPTPAPQGKTVTITGSTVNIRKGPSKNFDVRIVAKKGDVFPIVDADGWVPFVHKDCVVWMSGSYVASGKVTGSNVNIRKGPGVKYDTVGVLKRGAKLDIVSTKWHPVELSGAVYWVSDTYAQIN